MVSDKFCTIPAGNVEYEESDELGGLIRRWWDPEGEFRIIHRINRFRCRYIERCCGGLIGKSGLDLRCGGGILCEAMAEKGARMTGIDEDRSAISVAHRHAKDQGLDIAYHVATVESATDWCPVFFNLVTCQEFVERLPDPESVIRFGARLLKPGGHLIVTAMNRTFRGQLPGNAAASRISRILSARKHGRYRAISHRTVAGWGRQAGLEVENISSMRRGAFGRFHGIHRSLAEIFMMHLIKPAIGQGHHG